MEVLTIYEKDATETFLNVPGDAPDTLKVTVFIKRNENEDEINKLKKKKHVNIVYAHTMGKYAVSHRITEYVCTNINPSDKIILMVNDFNLCNESFVILGHKMPKSNPAIVYTLMKDKTLLNLAILEMPQYVCKFTRSLVSTTPCIVFQHEVCCRCKTPFKCNHDKQVKAKDHSDHYYRDCKAVGCPKKYCNNQKIDHIHPKCTGDDNCGKIFIDQAALNLHLEYLLLNTVPCENCKERFTDKGLMFDHVRSLHPEFCPSDDINVLLVDHENGIQKFLDAPGPIPPNVKIFIFVQKDSNDPRIVKWKKTGRYNIIYANSNEPEAADKRLHQYICETEFKLNDIVTIVKGKEKGYGESLELLRLKSGNRSELLNALGMTLLSAPGIIDKKYICNFSYSLVEENECNTIHGRVCEFCSDRNRHSGG